MIRYRRPKTEELKDIARMCALTFSDYPICNDIRKGFEDLDTFIDFLSDVFYVYIKAYYKNSVFFAGEEDGKVKSFAILVRPRSSEVNLLDYFKAGALGLLNKASLPRLIKFLNVLEKGHIPGSGMKNHSWLLESLSVDRSCRGQQLGSKILSECIIPYIKEQSIGEKPETLITFTNTEANKRFYLKNGFTEFDYSTIQMNESPIGNWSFRMAVNPD